LAAPFSLSDQQDFMPTIEVTHYPSLIAATEPHPRAAYELLKEASLAAPDASNRQRLARLAARCEAAIHPLTHLASVLDAQETLLTHHKEIA
jgi:hypothetical protein